MAVERVLFGKKRMVPEAEERGNMADATRWRILRDGVADVIKYLPKGERQLGTRLGEVWAWLDSRIEGDDGTRGNWLSLF